MSDPLTCDVCQHLLSSPRIWFFYCSDECRDIYETQRRLYAMSIPRS